MKHIINTRRFLLAAVFCLALLGTVLVFPQETFAASSSVETSTASVSPAQVKAMIKQIFGPRYEDAALRVAYCESRYDPKARNRISGAAGVFQFLLSTWKTTSQRHHSRFDARANIKAAYEVFKRDGYSWREWQCKP